MAKQKTTGNGKAPNKRTPEDSVKVALEKSKATIEPGINNEIKDIVKDILNGNLKKAMDANVTDKVRKIGLKENEEALDEKELILGGKSEDDGAGHKQVKPDVTDVTSNGKQEGGKQDGETMHEGEEEVISGELEIDGSTEENDIEEKLKEMGYGTEEVTDETVQPEIEDNEFAEIDLEKVGYGQNEAHDTFGEEETLDVETDPIEEPIGGEEIEAPMEAPMEEPIEAPVDAEVSMEEPIEAPVEVQIAQMDYADLGDEDQSDIDEYQKDIDDIRGKLTNELESFGESILPKEKQDKLSVYFEMLADKKADIIAKKQVATVVDKTNDYMEYVVKEFVSNKEKEIKEAVESSKKTEIYENFKHLVEKMYGDNLTDIMESKKSEEFLINVIAEMKNENEKLETSLTEARESLAEMECTVIFQEMTKTATYTEKAKLAEFVETFDYNTVGDFKRKLSIVIEQFNNLKKDSSKRPTAKKQVNIDEKKIVNAVKRNRINESIDEIEEIDPGIYNSNLW